MIGDDILVEVIEVWGGKVRLGFTAPQSVPIVREEVLAEQEIEGHILPNLSLD